MDRIVIYLLAIISAISIASSSKENRGICYGLIVIAFVILYCFGR